MPIKKEITRTDNIGNDKIINISYKIKFIDSFRFMSNSLSNLVDNLSEGLHSDRCTDCKSCLHYMTTKVEQLIFNLFECKKNYKKEFNKELIKRFANIHEFGNEDINKFILKLFKEAFYSSLNLENITDADHRHAKRVFNNLSNKNIGDYHDLYVQSDTLLLADAFENFRNMCIKVYELDPAHFLSAPGLAWQACLKKTEVELQLFTDVDMLLMVEKGIRRGICHAIHRYAKINNKYIKNYDENEESSFLEYLDAKNLYGWAMSQKLHVDGFKFVKYLSKIDEDVIKNYDEDSDKGYILEVDAKYPKNLHELHSDSPFLPERMKIDKCSKLLWNLYVVHIKSLKQALNHGLILKKVHRVIQFNQESWL